MGLFFLFSIKHEKFGEISPQKTRTRDLKKGRTAYIYNVRRCIRVGAPIEFS
ncbi:MAG: hypothetical protein K0R93_1543 [Anaerosolibacter sp.]|jgi:hypothetical protein|nr:hypothetical protein [Anaerosolibacter sp.]